MKTLLISILLIGLMVEYTVSLTMLGLTRGTRIGSFGEGPPYFPEEDDLPPKRDPNAQTTFERPIGTVAGRELVARRWKENQPRHREILDSIGVPLRRRPVVARVLDRGGGIHI